MFYMGRMEIISHDHNRDPTRNTPPPPCGPNGGQILHRFPSRRVTSSKGVGKDQVQGSEKDLVSAASGVHAVASPSYETNSVRQ